MKHSDKSQQFTRLGRFGTSAEREAVVQYLQAGDKTGTAKEPMFALFPELLQPIAEHPEWTQAAQDFPHLVPTWHQAVYDYLNGAETELRKTDADLADEIELRNAVQREEVLAFLSDWKKGHPSFDELSLRYTKDEINPHFYWQQNQALLKAYKQRQREAARLARAGKSVAAVQFTKADRLKGEAIKEALCQTWEALLSAKIKTQAQQKAQQLCGDFLEEWLQQLTQYRKLHSLLGFFIQDMGKLWNLAQGDWHTEGMANLLQYAQLLEQEKGIQDLANLLGRLRRQEERWEYEQLQVTHTVHRPTINPAGKADLVGIHESQDLSQLLPSELALFGDVQTEGVFFKKFSEHKLQTYRLQSVEPEAITITTTEEQKVAKHEAQGPFIICVDTSGSMQGAPERWAKAIALAILKLALDQNREAFLISFATQIQTLALHELPQSLPRLVEFLQRSFHGGTDATPALVAACQKMQEQTYQKADVLMITDAVMPTPPEEMLAQIARQKELGNRFYALLIEHAHPPTSLGFWDAQWQIDLREEEASLRRIIDALKGTLDH